MITPTAASADPAAGLRPRATHQPCFGVIIVNWNGHRDTIECLESLFMSHERPARAVVVDNGSSDGSLTQLTNWARRTALPFSVFGDTPESWPQIDAQCSSLVFLTSHWNRGFSGGNNLGLAFIERYPELSHFLLLNNDAVVDRGFCTELRLAAVANPNAGLLTGTIYRATGEKEVWYAGGYIVGTRSLVVHHLELPPSSEPASTEFVCGCTMLVSREALGVVGGLAECYFPGYMEDAEYSVRVRAAGFRLIYAPRAIAYHKVGSSAGLPSIRPAVAYCLSKHRALFARRNLTGAARVAAVSFLMLSKPIRALLDTLRGHPRIGAAIFLGTLEGLVTRSASSHRTSLNDLRDRWLAARSIERRP